MMSEVTPRTSNDDEVFVSPADRLISNLDGVYYKLTEAAELLKVSPTTLRRLLKNPGISAPSYQIKQGKMLIYLYTPGDIAELAKYFGAQVPEKRNYGTEGHSEE